MSAAPANTGSSSTSTTLLAPGDMIDGRYRIEAYLGGGGMASVYRATHVVLEQTVAIKVVSPQIRDIAGMAQRFMREARAATHLKSEHIARVSDVGTMADGAPYMVMEYLAGQDLDAVIDGDIEIGVEESVDYVLQACEALAEVHGLGIVHRDLKPANLFLTRGADGLPCVKLIDFGISRTDSPLSPKDTVGLTQPDMVMGSPRYMSPEQMESAKTADCRSDIYGTGAVLYELLTRHVPHEGDTFMDIYAKVTLGPAAAPSTFRPEVPKELDAVILRCLSLDPADRYADAAELARALAPFGPAGSLAKADAIARVLEAARERTRDGGAVSSSENVVSTSRSDSSHVRRVSSSAHALRKRRIRHGIMGALVVGLALVATGGSVFYTQLTDAMYDATSSGPSAAAAAAIPVAPLAAFAPFESVTVPKAEVPSADDTTPSHPTVAVGTTETTGAHALGAQGSLAPQPTVAAAMPAQAEPQAEPELVKPAAVVPAAPPPPRWTATPRSAAAASSPSDEERKLFEDRK